MRIWTIVRQNLVLPQGLNGLSALLFSFLITACNPVGDTTIGQNFYPGVTLSNSNSTVMVLNPQILAGSSTAVTVYLQDTTGNPFVSTLPTVTLQTSGGTSSGVFSSITNNGDGSYSSTFTGMNTGAATTIQAVVDGAVLTSVLPTVTVVAGNYSLSNSHLTLSSSTDISGSGVTATLTVNDNSGNPLPSGGLSVVFSNTGGTSAGSWSGLVDHGNGTYTDTFTGTTAGTATTISATIQGQAITSTLPTLTVLVGSPASIAVVSASNNQSTAVSSTLGSALQALVTDSGGNTVGAGIAVSWATTTAGASTTGCTSSTTNSSGVASCAPTLSSTAGSNVFTASVAGVATPASFAATGTASSTIASIVWGTAPSLTYTASNSAAMTTFTAILKDAGGNTITSNSSTTVTASITSGSGTLGGTTTVTVSNGVATFSAVTDTTASTITIQAKENTANTTITQASVVVSAASTISSLVWGTAPSLTYTASNSSVMTTFTAKLEDAYGNVISGNSSTTVTASITSGLGTLGGTTTVTASNGVATFSAVTDTTASTITIQAKENTSNNVVTRTSVVVSPVSTISSLIWGAAPSLTYTASSSTPMTTFTAKLEDTYGNVITSNSSTTVTASITSGSGTLGGTTTVTASSGIATFSAVTDTTASTITIQAKENTSNNTLTQTSIVVSPSSTIASIAWGTAPSLVYTASNSAAMTTFTAILKDSGGNTITTNSTTTVTASITSGSGTLGGTTTVTASNGIATFSSVTASTASTITIQAKENTSNNVLTQSSVVVSAGAFSLAQSQVSSASSVASGSAITVTLTAEDAYGNTNPTGVTAVTFTSSSVGGTGTYGSVTNAGSGVYTASFTGVTSGSCTLGATINSGIVTSTATPASITINPSSTIASVTWGTAPSTSYTASSSTPMTTFTALLTDANGNTITTNSATTVTASITSGSGTLGGTVTVTASSGVASFSAVTDTTASTITIRAKENTSNHTVSQASVVVGPGSLSSITFTTGPSASISADSTQTIAVTEYDSNSNVLSGDSSSGLTLAAYSTTNCATSTVSSALSATSGTASSGVFTMTSFGIYKTSVQSVLATVGSKTVCAGSLTVTAGAASAITATSGSAQSSADGVALTNPLIATVVDDHGNVVGSGTAVTWAITSGNGSCTTSTTSTNSSGQVSCSFKNGTGSPSTTNTITATASGITTPASFTETGTSTPFSASWNFASPSPYTISSPTIDMNNGYAELTPSNPTDSSDVSAGFGGGTTTGTAWDVNSNNYMRLDHTGTATYRELDSSWAPAWSSLVAYWKLNETAGSTSVADSGPVATHSGTPTNVTLGSAGKLSTAASFAGTTSAITVPYNVSLTTASFTVGAWINITAADTNNRVLVENRSTTTNGWVLYYNSTSFAGKISNTTINGTTVPALSTWTHVMLTYNGTTASLYVNGQFQSSGNGALTLNPSSNLVIGNSGVGALAAEGILDDVALWNTALSSSAVSALYQHESAKYAGTFTSRVMDGVVPSPTWSTLAWTTTLPFGKELPDTVTATPSPLVSPSPVSESSSVYSSQSSTLMNGLMGLWHLDEPVSTTGTGSILDRSGYGNNGTPANVTFGAAGKFGTAGNFNGTSSVIKLPNPSAIKTNAISGVAWVSPATSTYTAVTRVLSNYAANWSFVMSNTSGGATMRCLITTSSGSATATSTTPINQPGQWYHLACVWDGTTVHMYVNGQDQSDTPLAGTLNLPGNAFAIGADPSNQYYWNGQIDEVGLWNRALTATEVLELYRRGANRVRYQVQTCATSAACASSPNWLGPDGTSQSYFTELNNNAVQTAGADLSLSDFVQTSSPLMTFANFGTPLTTNLATNRYFQYRAVMESDDTSTSCNYGGSYTATWCSPEVQTVATAVNSYDTTSPSITNNVGVNFATLTSLVETLGTGGCSSGTVYNLSANGTTWYYWNGSAWASAGGTAATATSASTLMSNLATFPSTGTFYFKVFLRSTGTSPCVLTNLAVGGTQ